MNSEELNSEFLKVKDSAYRYAVSLLRNREESEDLVQDLYERLWRRRLFVRVGGFHSLVMTSVRNMAIDCLRQRERSRPPSVVEEPRIESDDGTEGAESLLPIITRLIDQLPEREREVMHLREVEGMTFDEIASVVGSSQVAVRMAASRARQKIKEKLIKEINYGL